MSALESPQVVTVVGVDAAGVTGTARSAAGATASGVIVDDGRRAELRRMKTVALSLLVVAGIVFLVARSMEDDGAAWVGYVRATAEAAMVGALADWFAVTALFRHPLGIPIPHTAIIPRRKDQIGRSLGDFVESNFLTADVVDGRLRQAEVGRRVGRWLAEPANAERVGSAAADAVGGVLEVLDDSQIQQALAGMVEAKVRDTPATPIAGRALDLAIEGGHHQRVLDAVLVAIENFMADNRATFQARIYDESPWWVPESVDDRVLMKIYDVAGRFLADVSSNPDHDVRRNVDRRIVEFAARLRTDPILREKGEAFKDEMLAHPEVRRWIDSLWWEAKRTLIDGASDPTSDLRRRLVSTVRQVGERLADDTELQGRVDAWVSRSVAYVVENYRTEVSDVIASTVDRWDGAATADKLELQVGRDLQFIRINGTIVGGLAGLVIHAVGELL